MSEPAGPGSAAPDGPRDLESFIAERGGRMRGVPGATPPSTTSRVMRTGSSYEPRPVDTGLRVEPRTVVLDGGLGTLLEARGGDVSSALWSARMLIDEPQRIRSAHEEFAAAGADVAITASYQVTAEGLAAAGLAPELFETLLVRSVDLARAAVGRDGTVAASIGPYGAMLADGSEYRGAYGLDAATLARWHEPRIRVLDAAGADLLAVETIPSLTEVEAIVAALDGCVTPAWLSVTPSSGRMRTGEPLAEAFAVAAASEQVVAVGVNCCAPAEVLPAILAARSVTDKPIVVYPNSGEEWDARARVWRGSPTFPTALVRSWIGAGATIVGGCCRVGPEQIRAIRAVVDEGSAEPSR